MHSIKQIIPVVNYSIAKILFFKPSVLVKSGESYLDAWRCWWAREAVGRPPFAWLGCKNDHAHWNHAQSHNIKEESMIVLWLFKVFVKIFKTLGLPWWRSGYESACQCRGHKFEPWSGKIPRAAEQLSLSNYWAREPQLLKLVHLEPMLRNQRSHRNEKATHRIEE